jgi:hypothetical protein
MGTPAHDLEVACRPSLAPDSDVAFVAERLFPAASDHWVLYITSDQVVVDIRRVVPESVGQALHPSGALGLLFPAGVTTVHLEVAGGPTQQRWRFWVDDEPDVTVTEA